MTPQTIVLVLGGLLLVIGVIGGGFQIKEISVPKIGGISRGLSLIGGIVLIGIGITVLNQSLHKTEKSRPLPDPASVPELPIVPKISIVAGTYGGNCGAPYSNETEHLVTQCDGKRSCVYIVDYKIIGDPKPGCKKDYIAEWKCGIDQPIHKRSAGAEAGYRSAINLSCE